MTAYTVDASPKSAQLDRSTYENDSARMIFAISRLANIGRLNVYEGTVPAGTIAKRRAANKVARASRRANR